MSASRLMSLFFLGILFMLLVVGGLFYGVVNDKAKSKGFFSMKETLFSGVIADVGGESKAGFQPGRDFKPTSPRLRKRPREFR